MDCFLFESSYIWVKLVKKYSKLALALSTFSPVIFGGCVRSFVTVSFIYQLDPGIRRLVRRLEHLHLKI